MKLYAEMLTDAMKEQYKAEKIIRTVSDLYKEIIRETIFEEYGSVYKFLNGTKYALSDVKIRFSPCISYRNSASVKLFYTYASKLNKRNRERLNEIKVQFSKTAYVEKSKHKTPLWFVSRYELRFDDILKERFNLLKN